MERWENIRVTTGTKKMNKKASFQDSELVIIMGKCCLWGKKKKRKQYNKNNVTLAHRGWGLNQGEKKHSMQTAAHDLLPVLA